jgi:hypothetical protein
MRLNEKTYPAFATLEKKQYEWLKIDQLFETILTDNQKFFDFLEALKSIHKQVDRKYYLTNTFKSSLLQAYPKISEKKLHYNYIPSGCGIIFTDNGFSLYLSNPTDKKLKLAIYGFTKDVLTTYGIVDNDNNFYGIAASLDENGNPINDTERLASYLDSTLLALYFIENCEIEEKIIKPNEKHRENGNKHFNESKSDIIFLDCKWFTDLIREAPFRVKGHLRWQVCGEKKTKRKLIWIDEFEKAGYVRKNKKSEVFS